MMAKRSRGWAYPEVKEVTHFLLDINSINSSDSSSSAVEFEYNVSDKIGPLFYNGKLNLRASDAWSVALSNFSMPNNFETFPSIDAQSNLSAAFVSVQFEVHYTAGGKNIETAIKIPVTHFPHRRYTSEEVLMTLRELIDKGLYSIDASETKKLISNEFWKSVADFYIAPDSGFVYIKAIPTAKPNPILEHSFVTVLWKNLKEGVLPNKKSDIHDIRFKGAFIWTGKHVIDYLGTFHGKLWKEGKLSGDTFHGDVLDTLIFSYPFNSIVKNGCILFQIKLVTGIDRVPYILKQT